MTLFHVFNYRTMGMSHLIYSSTSKHRMRRLIRTAVILGTVYSRRYLVVRLAS